ncbi:hypothetical protein P5673_029275 [Acropora cervicornis]|uniref:THAP-type domain-containing protein n=1 Tax=Acropora cervicornis TaxID=6130 RepID=A0AAD9PW13_ACRCE|nr:hypothetical protein P5673_029275 [Acropora cervicornis]
MPPLENCFVCSEHFSAESFEVNLHAQITGPKCKRRLEEDAIPSEFCFRPPAKRPRLAKIVFDVEATKTLASFVSRSSSRIVISIILNVVKYSYANYQY